MALLKHIDMRKTTICSWIQICSFLVTMCLVITSDAAVQKTPINNLDIPKIDLLLSGGGFRASAFAYGVMAGLNEICLSAQTGEFKPREKDSQNELKNCAEGVSLLDHVNIISAVSGGAITAAYFKTHREEFFEEFPKILKKTNLQWQLFKAEKSPTWKRTLRSPVFLLTSIWDTIGSIIGLPLSLFNLNIELTPVAVMALSDGLLESEQLARVYKDLFYQDTRLGNEAIQDGFPFASIFGIRNNASSSPMPTILINASDIANGTVFTFDDRTFECMGVSLPSANVELALAVAASSSLPGVFSPVRLDNVLEKSDPTSIPTNCSLALADPTRKPLLVDGGVTDNLGAVGLLRDVIAAKEAFIEPEDVNAGKTTSSRVHPEDPSQKHLLLFVNSEAVADSHLPGLAGHFDSSYDVLIRSKKDLVRVMASDMFNHFGFGMVEFKLSDIVSSEPGIKSLVTLHHDEMSDGYSSDNDAANTIPHVLTATEQEQRTLQNLIKVGMLPSHQEIDGLIMAGRKIVANRLHDLKVASNTLKGKTFSSVCSNIANPDRFFCWPDSFRSHDLQSGGGSAFLQTVTSVTNSYIKDVARAKSMQLAALKDKARGHIADEERVTQFVGLEDQYNWTKWHHELNKLYSKMGLIQWQPGCEQASENLLKKLAEAATDETEKDQETKARKFKEQLRNELKDAACNPQYYFLLSMVERTSTKEDQNIPIHIYSEALRRSDPTLNHMMIHAFLGAALMSYHKDYFGGLDHLRTAINLASTHEAKLKLILSNANIASEDLQRSQASLKIIQDYKFQLMLLHSQSLLISPIPIQGSIEEIHERDVLAWERKYLRYKDGQSLLEELSMRNGHQLSKSHRARILESLKHSSEADEHTEALIELLNGPSPTRLQHQRDDHHQVCGKSLSKHHWVDLEIVDQARCHIIHHLAKRAGFLEGRKEMERAYSDVLNDTQKVEHFTLSDIYATYGLYQILMHHDASCTIRMPAIKFGKHLIKTATDMLKDHKAEAFDPEIPELMDKRFRAYATMGGLVGCSLDSTN